MKRRKPGGTPTTHAAKTRHLATRKTVPAEIVPVMMEQTSRNEIKERIDARKLPPRKTASKQPPPSDELKTVTEIGGRRWKSGQTK